ncbi:MAG: helix-turn-helix transcriptional regulator [Candidatus Firestonebacteria bacterium]|mgnify:CR=1 FL=1
MNEFNELYKLLGNRIKCLRTEQNLTQEKLSEKSNLHNSYIGLIERGAKGPSLETLQKIADALNVSLVDLFVEESKWKSKDRKHRELFNVIKNRTSKQIDILIKIAKIIFT